MFRDVFHATTRPLALHFVGCLCFWINSYLKFTRPVKVWLLQNVNEWWTTKILIVYKTNKTTISVLVCETRRLPVDDCQVSIFRVLLGPLDDQAYFISENPYKSFYRMKSTVTDISTFYPCIFSCENLPTSQHSSDSSLENAFCCWFLHLMVATQLFLSVSNALLLDQSRIAVWFSIYTVFYDERSFSSVFVSLDSRDPRSKPMPLDCIP